MINKFDGKDYLSSIDEIIADVRKGRMVILVDDEDRENEGDLVIPAEMATAEVINFMAKFGRGLVCLAMTRDRCESLGLQLMSKDNRSQYQTAFTVSIEAREGVTTGISAADRAHTIKVAIDPKMTARDIATPGHVFPLVARDGGTLVRAGHTEAAVDIARLAGLNPSGVICEIMNDDGTMARLPDLVKFAQHHGLKVGTIAELIRYRRQNDNLVRRVVEREIDSEFGGKFQTIVYANTIEHSEHIALVKGDVSGDRPTMVRMHALRIDDDLLGEKGGRHDQLQAAMRMIGEEGRGVIVLLRDSRPNALSEQTKRKLGHEVDNDTRLRDYGIGAQILLDLGLKNLIVLSNTINRQIIGIDGYGLNVVETRPIVPKKVR